MLTQINRRGGQRESTWPSAMRSIPCAAGSRITNCSSIHRRTESAAPLRTVASRSTRPSSTSCISAVAVNVFEVDPIWNSVSGVVSMPVPTLAMAQSWLQPAVQLLQSVYQLPAPIAPAPDYQLALMYPIRPNLPLTIWNIGDVEVVYQPVLGEPLVTGQLWLADRNLVSECPSLPKL